MNYDEAVFVIQFPLIKRFIHHYIYYKESYNLYKKLNLQSEFWSHTIDAHILQAAILWCMIFGPDGDQNQTHWKKLSTNEQLHKRFREILFQRTGFDKKSWGSYWQDMVYFRNNYAAHRELEYNRTVPNFEKALDVAYAYDEWVREILSDTHEEAGELIFPYLEEPPFEESAEELRKFVVSLLELLFKQTQQYNQKV